MDQFVLAAANVVAICILVFGIYFPRHRRRDMIVAYLAINTGVLALSVTLMSVNASIGLGFGLFGVLSIIRLRSDELTQREVSYYFASLALGLLGGTLSSSIELNIGLMALLVGALWIGDHPRLLGRYRTRLMTLDRAINDEAQLTSYLEGVLGGKVRQLAIHQIDMVNDTTRVEVRYELLPAQSPGQFTERASVGSLVRP
ncbi:MAG: DUF4956 domain-containing protein [Thermomicrobiales bacterium]|nr:DUF4956 domain-containing protein [Thermomicrobiales bacterium]